jgi:hypothetical protein
MYKHVFLYHVYGPLVGIVRYIHGTLELQIDQLPGWIIFFSNSYLYVRHAKFGWLTKNTVRYLKQDLLSFQAQHIPSCLSIIINWSTEGNISLNLAYSLAHNASYYAIKIFDVTNKCSETAGAKQFKFFAIMNTFPGECLWLSNFPKQQKESVGCRKLTFMTNLMAWQFLGIRRTSDPDKMWIKRNSKRRVNGT